MNHQSTTSVRRGADGAFAFQNRPTKGEDPALVAQVCDLPCRRLVAGSASPMELASAGCKPAIRQTGGAGGLRYAFGYTLLIAALLLLFGGGAEAAVSVPVVRSTSYNGAYSNIVYYPVQPWMNTNTVNLTVEAWVRANDLIGHQALVARNFTTNLYFGLNGNRLRLYRSGGTSVDSTGTVAARRWTHVAATYDGTTARFYIDGVAAGAAALASRGNDCTNSLSLGGQRDNAILANGYAFNGSLDEVRLWSVVRSQSQIASSMNQELRSGTGLLATPSM
jgi:hypothetical protein